MNTFLDIILRVNRDVNSSEGVPFWMNMLCNIALCLLIIRLYFANKNKKDEDYRCIYDPAGVIESDIVVL